MKLSALISTMPLPEGAGDIEITGLTADSRLVKPGMMFAALPGSVSDGRDYIAKAIENGAVAIVSTPNLTNISVPYIAVQNPRETYAFFAAQLHAGQPKTIVAMTGTNGKSSTIEFLRQIWAKQGKNAACFGTLGVVTNSESIPLTHTTPDAVALHHTLSDLAQQGVTHCGMEASSHGLDQNRLDAVTLSAIGFSNLSQDHFDYHGTLEVYFEAKSRLFTQLAPRGIPAVINVDGEHGRRLAALSKARGLEVLTVGFKGEDLKIISITPHNAGQKIQMVWRADPVEVNLPLIGEYQVLNAVSAAALAISTGVKPSSAFKAFGGLEGVNGRMEQVGTAASGAPVYVDFAHTPGGLETLLQGVRPHVTGRIVLVFGCGGDRDPDKRAKMGVIAALHSEFVIVTDDNPRTENPENIRAQVLEGCPDAMQIGDRERAIAYAIGALGPNDCLVIAGKGHESGQIVGKTVIAFKDADVARAALEAQRESLIEQGEKAMSAGQWSAHALAQATGGKVTGYWESVSGLSIDTRSIEAGELFIPLKDQRDGHDFIPMALERGAVVMSERSLADVPAIKVDDALLALRNMATFARHRSRAIRIAVTGSVGKTSVKEAAALALSATGVTHKSIKSFNNHWGVPLTMASLAQDAQFAVFETGMNHAGELSDLSKLICPHIAVITKIAPAHLEHFEDLDAIANAKMEIFEGLTQRRGFGCAVLNADDPYCGKFIDQLTSMGLKAITVGRERGTLIYTPVAGGVDINCAQYSGHIKLRQSGDHHALNAALAMAIAFAAHADLEAAARALSTLEAIAGRGAQFETILGDKAVTIIDESYNANPESMRAALAAAGQMEGRRVAVLGDMLELGPNSEDMHSALANVLVSHSFDRVITVGQHMRALNAALGETQRGPHVESAKDVLSALGAEAENGDIILLKASNSIGLGAVVSHLKSNQTKKGSA